MRGRRHVFFATEAGRSGFPDCIEDAWADIAAVFHWPPSEIQGMSVSELVDWRNRAIERSETES